MQIANVQKATEALVSYLGLKFKVKTRDVPSPIEEKGNLSSKTVVFE